MRIKSKLICNCSRTCWKICLSGKKIAGPRSRAVRSHPYTLEWRLIVVVGHISSPRRLPLNSQQGSIQETFSEGRKVSSRQTKWQSSWLFPRMHMQRDKRSFHSENWEFEALIQVRTLTEIGCSGRSKKRSGFVPFRCMPQWVVLARMSTWFIPLSGEEDGCMLRCASDRINRQLRWFTNYHLISDQLIWLYKHKDMVYGNKIKLQM